VSWEEPRKIKCPICNVDMKYENCEWEEGYIIEFECPECGLSMRLYFGEEQILKTILSKIGYEEVEVKAEKGEESEAEG